MILMRHFFGVPYFIPWLSLIIVSSSGSLASPHRPPRRARLHLLPFPDLDPPVPPPRLLRHPSPSSPLLLLLPGGVGKKQGS